MGNSASTSQLSPAGSSTYASSILHVGDGTWDSARDAFLLPNIQGLNFAAMRYNGMGNRFESLSGYHNLIIGHGVVAAITFLGVVPAAIFLARFYQRNPRRALRLHIGLQITTVILTTVTFILGYFAVGPERSLTNPHHGIGTAIFVLVLIQALAGALIHRVEKGKARTHLPIRLMLHQWIGRGIALLGIAQIPIGLTLYGSPLYLFVLYALVVLALLTLYFVLTYQSYKPLPEEYHERDSYISGTQTELTDASRSQTQGKRRGFGAITAALSGGTGLTALRRRRSTEFHDDRRNTHVLGQDSLGVSGSDMQEKQSEEARSRGQFSSWRSKLTALTAGGLGLETLKGTKERKLRKNRKDRKGDYQQPHGSGDVSDLSTLHALEEGRTNQNHTWQSVEDREAAQQARMNETSAEAKSSERPVSRRRTSVRSDSSWDSRRSNYGPRKAGGLSGAGGLGKYFRRRRERKEQLRVEAERQREYENRRVFGQQRDTVPPNRVVVDTQSTWGPSGRQNEASHSNLAASLGQANMVPAAAASRMNGPPRDSLGRTGDDNGGGNGHPIFGDEPAPPPPPVHSSPLIGPPSNLQRRPASQDQGLMMPVQGPVYSGEASPRLYNNSTPEAYGAVGNRPPVAVKVKVHNDGTHVTLRRLGEEEAARERLARRQERNPSRRRRGSSLSETSDGHGQRFRRSDTAFARPPRVEASLPSAMRSNVQQARAPVTSPHSGVMGSSPGFTGTDLSYYDTNRQRRRAERQRLESTADMSGAGGDDGRSTGPRVTFT